MQPQLGHELAATRMSDMTRRIERSAMVKEARGARRTAKRQTPPTQGRFVPAGALRLGRALRRLRSKPAQTVAC